MPTYQYACTACDHRFEAVQSFSDSALTECPECEGRLRKVFSAVGVVFKGSGFYRTDSRGSSSGASGSGAAPAKADAKSDAKTGSDASSSSTSAPASSTSGSTSGGAKGKESAA